MGALFPRFAIHIYLRYRTPFCEFYGYVIGALQSQVAV
jgi:hypothetical protein